MTSWTLATPILAGWIETPYPPGCQKLREPPSTRSVPLSVIERGIGTPSQSAFSSAPSPRSPAGLFTRRHATPKLNPSGHRTPSEPLAAGLGITAMELRLEDSDKGRHHLGPGHSRQRSSAGSTSLEKGSARSPRVARSVAFTSTSSPSLPIHFYKHAPSTRSTALHTTTQRWRESSAFWLSLYFLLNLGLTLHNKALLRDFPFPYTVTAVHSLFSSVGGYAMRRKRLYVPAQLSVENELVLLGFSVIYALNIAVSNVSLQKVTIPFHQAIRSLTPFLVLALSSWLLQSKCSPRKLLALVPVMVGVALATFGDYASTPSGLVVTLLGAFLAALKGLSTSLLQARRTPASSQPLARFRLGLHPHDLLARMSPLALVQCLFYAQSAGELARAARAVSARQAALLGANGVLAFGLNIVSFTANRRAGALSMSVASNVKQVLTVLLAVVIFDSRISRVNAYGVALTLLGGGWYAWVEHTEKKGPEVEGGSIRTRQ